MLFAPPLDLVEFLTLYRRALEEARFEFCVRRTQVRTVPEHTSLRDDEQLEYLRPERGK